MPYTPPSHRSPASSAPTTPDVSRRPSFQQAGGQRPNLPRSASYITRQRRTPSLVGLSNNGPANQPTPEATSEDLKSMVTSPSVRQSPPPVTETRGIPKGAVISPPESPSGSDEDDLPEVRGRRLDNLRELKDAISQIPQRRQISPSKGSSDGAVVTMAPQPPTASEPIVHHSFSATTLTELAQGARRISHSRSNTDSNVLVTKSADNSLTASEEESEEEVLKKPQMVRKKSGELVRPALRPPSRRRPSSMPGTPTYANKAVHFDSHLEHVRHFLQVDRPLAVSAGSSPAENYDSDSEFPFPRDERRTPPFEWEIIVNNFPVETPARKAQAVKLERVWLSTDQKCLTGSIAVANLAFQKFVTCRFTLDYWKTTSEVAADYVAEIRPREIPQGHDRFQFTIKLSDMANLESKTLYFCIRYNVNGQELWDNNGGTNFQVDFKKKPLPQNGKNGFQGAAGRPVGALPRSNRRANPSIAPRPKSMPAGSLDDFGDPTKIDFSQAQSVYDYLGESGTTLRLKGVKSTSNLPSDNLTSRLTSPSGQAFANRYDFGASLTAAVQAAKDAMLQPDGLYMRSGRKATSPLSGPPRPVPSDKSTVMGSATSNEAAAATNKALPPVPGTDSPTSGSISNASYEEILNKYCFFGSKQSSPQIKDGTLRGGSQLDGAADDFVTRESNSTNSSLDGSPIQTVHLRRTHGAQHHSMHADLNPYFQHAAALINLAASPAVSPPAQDGGSSGSSNTSQPPQRPSPPPALSASSASPGGFPPFAGTSSPSQFQYHHMQERFPFSGGEAHAATAITG